MTVQDMIIQKIKEAAYASVPITERSNLYTDIGFDSLSFIVLLMDIEETYSITFDIMEMERCIQVDQLIAIVESKRRERDKGDD